MHKAERAIKSTGVYDWQSDPNAFPEAALAATHDETNAKNNVQPAANDEEDTQLYNTVGSDYSLEWDSDEDDTMTATGIEDKAEALQNIRDAGKAMAKPLKPFAKSAQQVPNMHGHGRLKAELHCMRHEALRELGRAEYDRLHASLLQKWHAKEPLDKKALNELSKGDPTILKHCEQLVSIIAVTELL